MAPLNKLCVKLILWGSGPIAFVSGLIVSTAINIITSLALLDVRTWPNKGYMLLYGSTLLILASAAFALLAARIQPLKSKSDERLKERNRIVAKDEQHRTTMEFIWQEVVDAEGKSKEIKAKVLRPSIAGILLTIGGFILIVFSLAVVLQ